MPSTAADKNTDDNISAEKKLDELYELIDGIEIAMLTSRQIDGSLVSRPMQTQDRRPGVDLWFMTTTDTSKVDELRAQPDVNLSYYNAKSREWVSVSGRVRLNRDPERIKKLYKPDWKAWLGDEGGERDGGPGDPRIVLLDIEAQAVTYMKSNTSRTVALFKVVKAMITGDTPHVGDMRHLDKADLEVNR